jgi:hypothetical protein
MLDRHAHFPKEASMPNVTWTRAIGAQKIAYTGFDPSRSGSARDLSGTVDGAAGSQVTTSYRTGSAVESVQDPLFSIRTQGKVFQYLATEYQDQGGLNHDIGHEFHTEKKTCVIDAPIFHLLKGVGSSRWEWNGPAVFDWPHLTSWEGGTTWLTPGITSNPVTDGVAAVRATIPTHPAASLATALVETYRDGLPALVGAANWKERTSKARDLAKKSHKTQAEEYLNYQFGWLPMVADVKSVMKAVHGSSKILHQFHRDSGKNVRRRYTFPTTTDTKYRTTTGSIQMPTGSTFWTQLLSVLGGTVHQRKTTTIKRWFSGSYTYAAPEGNSFADKLVSHGQSAQRLLGLEITPEVLWNSAPWSWLADWKVNIGSNISNFTRLTSDGLVMRYGYLMTETTVTNELYLLPIPNTKVGVSGSVPGCSITFTTVIKDRVKASPYGFGLDTSSFTGRQWAILSALGMTRGNAQTLR